VNFIQKAFIGAKPQRKKIFDLTAAISISSSKGMAKNCHGWCVDT